MKNSLAAGVAGFLVVAGATIGSSALAQTTAAPAAEPAPAPTSGTALPFDLTLTGNANIYSDYRFRGFTQTGYKPAFQGGFDLSHSSGLYIGNWNSNVEQGLYRGASLEMDFYGGYKYTFLEDFTLDVGGYYYFYPTKRGSSDYYGYGKKADNGEVYVGLSWKTFSVKYWYAVTNYFGLGDSFQGGPSVDTKGSGYVDLNGSYEVYDGWSVLAHAGYQHVKNAAQFVDTNGDTLKGHVWDYKVGVTKDFSGYIVGVGWVGTSRKTYFGTTDLEAGGKGRVMGWVSKTF